VAAQGVAERLHGELRTSVGEEREVLPEVLENEALIFNAYLVLLHQLDDRGIRKLLVISHINSVCLQSRHKPLVRLRVGASGSTRALALICHDTPGSRLCSTTTWHEHETKPTQRHQTTTLIPNVQTTEDHEDLLPQRFGGEATSPRKVRGVLCHSRSGSKQKTRQESS
jgi:hypothetical protein